MKRKFSLPLFSLALTACGGPITDTATLDREGSVAFVTLTTEGERGTPAMPLPFSDMGAPLTLRAEVFDRYHHALPTFNGYLALSVTPGVIASITGATSIGNYVKLTNGRIEGVQIRVSRSYGEARVWAEDAGYVPVDPRRNPAPACADGIDNDNDGRTDFPSDTGCEAPNDDTERGGSFAVGVSEALYFSTPLIADVQGRTSQSPLVDQRITVLGSSDVTAPAEGSRLHRLVVTQTDNTGFFVSDIDDQSCEGTDGARVSCFNSLYSFNFRTPDGMRPCDLLTVLSGSVAEFVSSTQLAQPGFQVGVAWRPDDPAVGRCLIPDAVQITDSVARDAAVLERYESSLVRAVDVVLPTMIGAMLAPQGHPTMGATNCDLNNDGRITYGGNAEGACTNECVANATCTEWSSWSRYGQVTVAIPGSAGAMSARIAITPRAVSPSFDPEHPRGATATITGTLRQVGPNWIIQPRCEQDLVVAGDGQMVRPTSESCLHERTIGEELDATQESYDPECARCAVISRNGVCATGSANQHNGSAAEVE
jgi:hypothetical protein